MDDESIWQQLELQNEESIQSSLKNVSRFLAASTDKFKLNMDDMAADSDDEEASDDSVADEDEHEDEDENGVEENEDDVEDGFDQAQDEDDDQDCPSLPRKRYGKSIVDDQFFKLREMEEFLEREDKREMNPDMEDEIEEIDLFTEVDDTNREESLKYSDFFDDDQGDQGDEGDEDENEAQEKPDEPKSSFEMKQERLQKRIAHMEDRLLDNKPWQMKGEVKGDNRPQNSLLEEILEFDSTTRPAPIITEEVTLKLEDIIKQRIKDKAFDDVERKVKPTDIQMEFKKKLVLDQEKSKQSLAQLYEKEFVKELEKNKPDGDDEEPEEPKEHKEIRAELKDLFDKLDLLSNFYYTPRPAQPELKIITNLPTITMEEVAPVAVSDAAMLAPEEIKRKLKGDILGAGERTKTDKKRERRHKKVFQKNKFEKQTIGGKSLIEKVSKSRNVEQMKTGDTTKSSSAFFSKLQEGIDLEKSSKVNGKRKTEKPIHQAKKLKL